MDPSWGLTTGQLEEGQFVALDAAQRVIVEDDTPDPAVLGEHPRLRFDLLRREDTAHRREQRIPIEEFEIPGELLNTVDLAATLHLDRDRRAGGVPAEQ